MATDDHARDVVFKLIDGVRMAFGQEADAPQTAEHMLNRLAAALHPVAAFVKELPGLGPIYGNHFDELAFSLTDWSEGRFPELFDVQTKRKSSRSSLRSRARVNIVLAIEALMESGVSFKDKHRAIKNENDAANEIICEFEQLKREFKQSKKALVSASTIANWRTELSRRARPKDDAAMELLKAGRDYIHWLGEDCAALHRFARQRALAAARNFTWVVAGGTQPGSSKGT